MSIAVTADRLAPVEQALAPFTPNKPGLAALVTVGGEVVFERYLGGADLEHGAPVTAATRFHVASVSKQFTALAALLEADAGRVDLEADIHAYLPELADYGAKVTVSDLVHHTGGLRDQWDLMVLSGTPMDGVIRQSAILAMAARQRGLNFRPGTDFRYSNTGYSLLAEIVARTSGKSFAAYLEEAVFAPLGMRETLVYASASRLLAGRAMSYRIDAKGGVRLARLNFSNYGATSLHTTPRDLAKWAAELMHPRVLAPEVIARMTAPGRLRDGTPLNYGFGIMRDTLDGRPALTHAGGDAGFRAAFDCYPEDDAAVIVFSNGQADVGAMARTLADAFLSPAPSTPVTAPTPDAATLARLAGYYVSDWGAAITLEATGGKLMVRGGGALAPDEAKFLSDGAFYVFGPGYAYSATPAGDLTMAQAVGGRPVLYRRTERVKPSAEDLAAYAGRYRSDEIDSTYEIAVDGPGLSLACLRFEPLKLAPGDRDAFDGPWRLVFQRGADGAPNAFTLSSGRARGLVFRRVDAPSATGR
jgi:CubicO group peptidase (beta-lactamase class C family)